MTRKTKLHEIRDYVIIVLAMIEGSIGLNIFLLPNHITMGGVGGIASILCWGFGIPASVSYLALNVFLLLIAFRILGYKFCLKTIYGVGIFALTTRMIVEKILCSLSVEQEVFIHKLLHNSLS